MILDTETKEYIESILNNGETDIRGLYSVKNILEKENERFKQRETYRKKIINDLQNECSLISDVRFAGNYGYTHSDNVSLLIYLNSRLEEQGVKNYIKLIVENDEVKVLFPYDMSSAARYFIVEKGEYLYKMFAAYGINNNFNVHPIILTISNNFKIMLLDKSFVVNLIGNKKQIFTIKYNYDSGFDYYTNIFGLKNRVLKDNQDIYTFLKNLKIESANVPEYLKQSKTKIMRTI